jgi:hypothetical protein
MGPSITVCLSVAVFLASRKPALPGVFFSTNEKAFALLFRGVAQR